MATSIDAILDFHDDRAGRGRPAVAAIIQTMRLVGDANVTSRPMWRARQHGLCFLSRYHSCTRKSRPILKSNKTPDNTYETLISDSLHSAIHSFTNCPQLSCSAHLIYTQVINAIGSLFFIFTGTLFNLKKVAFILTSTTSLFTAQ